MGCGWQAEGVCPLWSQPRQSGVSKLILDMVLQR